MKQEIQGTPSMGDSTNRGGVWPSQASAHDLREVAGLRPRDDAGAPSLMTVSKASTPMQFDPFSLGNEETQDTLPTKEESPTLFITIRYFAPGGGTRTTRVSWSEGLNVQRAIKTARLFDAVFRMVSIRSYAHVIGQRRVRLHDTMRAGDVLRFNPTAKPFL